MDDIQKEFTHILSDYENALTDKRVLTGLLKDLLPDNGLETNLLLNLYEIGIHKEIEQAPQTDNAFTYRFIKRLCDEYGVKKENAEWAVNTWRSCYGKALSDKKAKAAEENESDNDTQNAYEKKLAVLRQSILELALEEYHLKGVFETVANNLNPAEGQRFMSHYRWFGKKVKSAIDNAGLNIISEGLADKPFDVGMAVTPVNLNDFNPDDELIIDRIIEPIVMEGESVVKKGAVALRRKSI